MNPSERDLRLRLLAAVRRLSERGLNQGSSGNASVRFEAGFIVTPSGKPYEGMEAEDLVFVDAGGKPHGRHAPSSEWRMHHDIFARVADAGAVVHTHSPYATTLACLHKPIPAFHYEVAFAGGNDIRCAGYATFGTQELSDYALAALEGRRACLLANHGQIAWSDDIEHAAVLAEKVEALAQRYCLALQLGEPPLLSDDEMKRVVGKFSSYGRSP
ncbi:MAG TPA: class II aldolase/adducin family protein [Usitatibacter sp.]|nr:class II aldolase/adducin family protein [Usitatibacter sp.]